ncbi:hypothetical protein H8F21_22185 [Pseudomonas sp. P66]|uniref:Uncharacterized protein n=1 Tax=Pseudomonas arcuscaelestis TaxID=2710591 RepID=A0ABS2C330_9PSED|nr:hypothetical protein [Pseudomonas arcuscaelestis]MBM5460277.1 hypothetical protein [Pseudomonas arcuscaelestis]
MPAPDNLTVQTPGEPITQTAPEQTSTEPKEPEYVGKHNGGGRYRIFYTPTGAEHGDWFSDFVATGEGAKEAAQVEADRLNAGGAPFVKPADPEPEAAAPAATTTQTAPEQTRPGVAVLTPEGWLVPELPANYSKE